MVFIGFFSDCSAASCPTSTAVAVNETQLGILSLPSSSAITSTSPLPGWKTPTEQKVVPRSNPMTFGLGGGRYCWPRYPARNKARIAEPVASEHRSEDRLTGPFCGYLIQKKSRYLTYQTLSLPPTSSHSRFKSRASKKINFMGF